MTIKRIIQIARRLNDFKYISFTTRQFYGRLLIAYQLSMLKRYHHGKTYDFKAIRDKKLFVIIKYAYKHSTYYKNIFDKDLQFPQNISSILVFSFFYFNKVFIWVSKIFSLQVVCT